MDDDTFQDEMDRIQLDQLHKVVLELAKNCFELKKLCVTVLISASVLVATFTTQRVDAALFIGGATIVLFFYVADCQSYFYQEKLRIRMRQIANAMADRRNPKIEIPGVGMPIGQQRLNQPRLVHAFFNASMWFYVFLFGIDLVLSLLYLLGLLQQTATP